MPRRESPTAAVEACADKGSRAAVYQCAVGRAGLYRQTFFGHKASPAERRWINDAWHAATKVDMKRRGLGRARRRGGLGCGCASLQGGNRRRRRRS